MEDFRIDFQMEGIDIESRPDGSNMEKSQRTKEVYFLVSIFVGQAILVLGIIYCVSR